MSHPPATVAPKRKNPNDSTDVDHASKKARKEGKKEKKTKKDKSKSKSQLQTNDVASSSSESEFRSVKASVQLTIPPVFATKPREGAQEMLDSMVMRCVSLWKWIVPRSCYFADGRSVDGCEYQVRD